MAKISLSSWSLILKMGYRDAIHFAVTQGFEGIEIWSNPVDFWPGEVTASEVDAIRSIARENDLSLAVHFCYGSNNLADYNQGHLNICIEQAKETISLCQRIGAEILVIHPGNIADFLPYHNKKEFRPELALTTLKRDAVDRFIKSLRKLASFAESHDVVLGLENLGYRQSHIQSTHEELAAWVDEIRSPGLKITLDVGHAHLEGGVEKAIKVLGSRIKHVHLDDNNGVYGVPSNHWELGTGTIDWKANASFLKSFKGMLSLEVRNDDDPEGAVLRSKSFIEQLIRGN